MGDEKEDEEAEEDDDGNEGNGPLRLEEGGGLLRLPVVGVGHRPRLVSEAVAVGGDVRRRAEGRPLHWQRRRFSLLAGV